MNVAWEAPIDAANRTATGTLPDRASRTGEMPLAMPVSNRACPLRLSLRIPEMTIMPASRLEESAPMTRNKGRIKVGADADITVFDPNTIIDNATFQNPAQFSTGVRHVLVNGVVTVEDGAIRDGVKPGRPIRRAG